VSNLLWCVRGLGADDLFAASSKAEAEATAAAHNMLIDKRFPHHPMRESMKVVAEQWPYSAESHATDLERNKKDEPEAL
jgi:hypothetical protein